MSKKLLTTTIFLGFASTGVLLTVGVWELYASLSNLGNDTPFMGFFIIFAIFLIMLAHIVGLYMKFTFLVTVGFYPLIMVAILVLHLILSAKEKASRKVNNLAQDKVLLTLSIIVIPLSILALYFVLNFNIPYNIGTVMDSTSTLYDPFIEGNTK